MMTGESGRMSSQLSISMSRASCTQVSHASNLNPRFTAAVTKGSLSASRECLPQAGQGSLHQRRFVFIFDEQRREDLRLELLVKVSSEQHTSEVVIVSKIFARTAVFLQVALL